MELVIKITVMLIFSSIFDGIILLTYFILDNNINKDIKKFIYAFFGISIINSVLYNLLSWLGLGFQVIFILYSSLLLSFMFNVKLKRAILSVIKVMFLLLIIESAISVILTNFFNIDMFSLDFNSKELFLYSPFKLIELSIIYFGKKYIKRW